MAAACVAAAGIHARPAAADEYDALNVVLGGSLVHDANLFRLPASVDPQLAVGKPTRAETIKVAYAGLRIDKPYAQQRFQLDVTQTAYRYGNFGFLDFDALEYRGAWLWRLTPRVSGTLSAEHKESLVPFMDFRVFQRNTRASDNHVFSLDGWLSGGWHLLLGASQYEQKNSQLFVAEADYRASAGEAGIKYVAASGSSIALIQRSLRGDYVNRVIDPVNFFDSGFRRNESELRANWNLSGHSVVTGRLTRLDHRHEHFAQRDFSGTAGQLAWAWTPQSKLRLDFSAKRDISAWWEAFASYRVNDTLSIAPTWQVSAKTQVRLKLDQVRSDFRGPVFTPTGPLRSDTVSSAQLGVDWSPLRSVSLGASLQRQRRSSNNAGVAFDDTIASVSASLMF
jgi:exopolysaccharide biosynthesis operon protein EpsL